MYEFVGILSSSQSWCSSGEHLGREKTTTGIAIIRATCFSRSLCNPAFRLSLHVRFSYLHYACGVLNAPEVLTVQPQYVQCSSFPNPRACRKEWYRPPGLLSYRYIKPYAASQNVGVAGDRVLSDQNGTAACCVTHPCTPCFRRGYRATTWQAESLGDLWPGSILSMMAKVAVHGLEYKCGVSRR